MSKRKMTLRRILCIAVSLSLLLSSVGAAHAASMPGQYDVVDLLSSGFFPYGDLVNTGTGLTREFKWTVTSTASFQYVYLNVSADARPAGVTLNGRSGSLVYTAANAAFYQYRFSIGDALTDVTVTVRMPSSVRQTVSIGYCVGTSASQVLFTDFDMKSRGYNSTVWNNVSDRSIPFKGRYHSSYAGDAMNVVNDFELQFSPVLMSADYATFHIVVPEFLWASRDGSDPALVETPSFFVKDGPNGAANQPLTILHSEVYLDSTYQMGIGRHAYHFIYTVDISGYDFSIKSLPLITMHFSINGYRVGSNSTDYYFYFDVLSCCMGFNADDGDPDRAFLPWLDSKLDAIAGAIHDSVNPPASDESEQARQELDNASQAMEEFEGNSFSSISSSSNSAGSDVSKGVARFDKSLAFVQRYTTFISEGIEDYLIVFTLPIFIGIFLYVCSRAPGITRAFRDRRPKE